MKVDTYWTIYNEIDDIIYEGTPVFTQRKDAHTWMVFNDGRPSSKVIRVKVSELMS